MTLLCSTLNSLGTSKAQIFMYAAGCVLRTFSMACGPWRLKSAESASRKSLLNDLRVASNDPPGHVQVAIGSVALMSPHIKAGALRPLAVTSANRFPQLPDTPTLRESGIPVGAESWWGILAPAKTPSEIIARMHAAMSKALQEPAV